MTITSRRARISASLSASITHEQRDARALAGDAAVSWHRRRRRRRERQRARMSQRGGSRHCRARRPARARPAIATIEGALPQRQLQQVRRRTTSTSSASRRSSDAPWRRGSRRRSRRGFIAAPRTAPAPPGSACGAPRRAPGAMTRAGQAQAVGALLGPRRRAPSASAATGAPRRRGAAASPSRATAPARAVSVNCLTIGARSLGRLFQWIERGGSPRW